MPSTPVRVLRSLCDRSDCFGYRASAPHNCTVLTEAPEPCPFYKTKARHLAELKAIRKKIARRYGVNV